MCRVIADPTRERAPRQREASARASSIRSLMASRLARIHRPRRWSRAHPGAPRLANRTRALAGDPSRTDASGASDAAGPRSASYPRAISAASHHARRSGQRGCTRRGRARTRHRRAQHDPALASSSGNARRRAPPPRRYEPSPGPDAASVLPARARTPRRPHHHERRLVALPLRAAAPRSRAAAWLIANATAR